MSTPFPCEARVVALVPHGRFALTTTRVVWALVVFLSVALTVTPWQQSASGAGRLIAYSPAERPQEIEAPIEGRILHWHVREGQHVSAGDPIVDLTDNDPEILLRLRAEREAVEARREAAQARIDAVGARAGAVVSSGRSATTAADSRRQMADARVISARRALEAAEANATATGLNRDRQSALYAQGLSSKRQVEVAEADHAKADAEVDRARAFLSAAETEVLALRADVHRTDQDATARVLDVEAARASARAELASADAELARMDVRLARQTTQNLRASVDGTILRIAAGQGGAIVKAGDPLAWLVPDTNDRAVELWVDGIDANLIAPGMMGRVQLEGWPAIQVSGWPTLALGTFRARVAFVDPAARGDGKFRVLLVPEEGAPWPPAERARQGMRAHGFVLMNRVRLGYEVWRRMNAFPPDWTHDDPTLAVGAKAKAGDK